MPKFTPRQRKHKINKREKHTAVVPQDTNVVELQPASKTEKEERRQELREELRAQQPKISSKKQKRLDKYIENKLKKEENLALLKKLADSKIDTSHLQSARHLGVSKDERPGDHGGARKRGRSVDVSNTDSSNSDSDGEVRPRKSENGRFSEKKQEATFGGGLKRPLEVGQDGFPVLKKRKRAPKQKLEVKELPWEGFDSEENSGSEDQDSESGAGSEASLDDDQESASGSDSESTSNEDSDDNDDGDEGSESSSEGSADEKPSLKPRASAFKAWAVQQINESVGFTPTLEAPEDLRPPQPQLPVTEEKCRSFVDEEEPLPLELQVTKGDPDRKAFSVRVDRPEEVQSARLELPVVGEEQKIMEAIHNNPSVVIWGATGSGKTTQLPQFLFEAGYGNPESSNPGMIAVTQPRRVAAVSMAKRVGDELGQYGNQVSYQIRFDSTVSNKTAIKFMTDGILLREIAQDFSLSKYSVIIIDEAHERSTNTDILIGMASRIVDLRKTMNEEDPSVKPLKLVIMSATLRISDFMQNSNLFRNGAPPLVQAEGRQYPVTTHFSRRTHRDYVEEAFRKVSRGHQKLPHGGFLVFLTGQNEIKDLEKRLKQAFKPTQRQSVQGKVQLSASEAPLETEDLDLGTSAGGAEDDYDNDEDSDVEITGLDNDEDDKDFDPEEGPMASSTQVHVVPLYSQLPTKEQLKVFESPPEGSRLIVIATNVAETSLTIPGIKYVFDCGRSKEKQYDLRTGVQTFEIGWISKASASQRAGRAGRTGPGHCYRLYSSAVYERDFAEYTDPEILRTPIEGVVLQMKSMGLHHVINFPFPTPPSQVGLVKAEKLLKNLGALSLDGQISELGKCLSIYPLSPRFGKMLQIGNAHNCIEYVIALVAALTVADLFIPENQLDIAAITRDDDQLYTNSDRLEDTAREKRRKDYNRAMRIFSKHDEASDALKSLAAVCAYAYAPDGDRFCEQMFIRSRALKETQQLRQQLTHIVRANNTGLLGEFRARLPEPSDKQVRALKQIVTAGFIDQVAIRADMAPTPPEIARKPKRAIDVPYLTLFPSLDGRATELDEKAVYVHPTSILSRLSPKELPQYITYSHLQRAAASSIAGDHTPKVRMHALTAPGGLHLSALAHGTPLIEYGKPIGKVESLGGKPEKRECWVIPALVGERGSTGWPLPAKKVVQSKDPKEGWVIEKFL